jgi:hypothetical protein
LTAPVNSFARHYTRQSAQILELLEQNTHLTEITQGLSERIKTLTDEIHQKLVHSNQ